MEDFKVGDQVVFISEIPHNPLLIGTKGEVIDVNDKLQTAAVVWDMFSEGTQYSTCVYMKNIMKIKEKSDMEKCKDNMVEAVLSLMECAEKVGGSAPDMNMTLKEFVTTYCWNGITFAITESKKRVLKKGQPCWNTRKEAFDVINSIENDDITIKLTSKGWTIEKENV